MHLIFFLKATLSNFYGWHRLVPRTVRMLRGRTSGYFLLVSVEKGRAEYPHLLASHYSIKRYEMAICGRIDEGATSQCVQFPRYSKIPVTALDADFLPGLDFFWWSTPWITSPEVFLA